MKRDLDWQQLLQLLVNATGETLYMVLLAALVTVLIGLPLGGGCSSAARVVCAPCRGSIACWGPWSTSGVPCLSWCC